MVIVGVTVENIDHSVLKSFKTILIEFYALLCTSLKFESNLFPRRTGTNLYWWECDSISRPT